MARARIFRVISEVENAYNKARFGTQPRNLTDADYVDWEYSLDNKKPDMKSREQAIAAIRRQNPYKWMECQRNFKWLQKTMRKLGLNPEDARFLL